jgi:hypothetical protein
MAVAVAPVALPGSSDGLISHSIQSSPSASYWSFGAASIYSQFITYLPSAVSKFGFTKIINPPAGPLSPTLYLVFSWVAPVVLSGSVVSDVVVSDFVVSMAVCPAPAATAAVVAVAVSSIVFSIFVVSATVLEEVQAVKPKIKTTISIRFKNFSVCLIFYSF